MMESLDVPLRIGTQLLLKLEPNGPAFIEKYMNLHMQEQQSALKRGVTFDKDFLKIATLVAFSIWKKTPLPSNNYQPSEHWPEYSDSCWCGSKKAFSRCCGKVIAKDGLEFIHQEQHIRILLEMIPYDAIATACQSIPSPVLAAVAANWTFEGDGALLDRARQIVEPIFMDNEMADQHPYEQALRVLLAIYCEQGKAAERETLIERMLQHPDKGMKKAAMEHQCHMMGEKGLYDEAMAQFQQLQKLDPDNLNLPYIELQLLASQGDRKTQKKRSQFWLQWLKKRNRNGELDEEILHIEHYAQEFSFEIDDDNKILKIKILKLNILVMDWLKQAKQQVPELIHEYRVRDGLAYIEPKTEKLKRIDQRWMDKAIGFYDDMGECLAILEENPELAGSIFVINDLQKLYEELLEANPKNKSELHLIVDIRNMLREIALQQLVTLIPEKPPYPFNMEEGNPSLVLDYLFTQVLYKIDADEPAAAITLLECAMLLDAEDIGDNRHLLIGLYLNDKRDQDVIRLCEQFPDDGDSRMVYGYPLALFRLGDKTKATQYMKKARTALPKVTDALLGKKIRARSHYDVEHITSGSDEEAMLYNVNFCQLWLKTHGAIACLKSCMRKG